MSCYAILLILKIFINFVKKLVYQYNFKWGNCCRKQLNIINLQPYFYLKFWNKNSLSILTNIVLYIQIHLFVIANRNHSLPHYLSLCAPAKISDSSGIFVSSTSLFLKFVSLTNWLTSNWKLVEKTVVKTNIYRNLY